MTWALIIMACTRYCTPTYAEVYQTKAECVVKVDKDTSFLHRPMSYCVPIVKGE